jgi:type VI secretion system protein ImpE
MLTLANGTELVGLIPARYPGSESSKDAAICLARKTDWQEYAAGWFLGLGQRMFATDAGEYPLLETRQIVLGEPSPETAEESANA